MEDEISDEIYGDLGDFEYGEKLKEQSQEIASLTERLNQSAVTIADLQNEIKQLKKVNRDLTKNESSLFLTAKMELDRKCRDITSLQQKVENRIFRRPNSFSIDVQTDPVATIDPLFYCNATNNNTTISEQTQIVGKCDPSNNTRIDLKNYSIPKKNRFTRHAATAPTSTCNGKIIPDSQEQPRPHLPKKNPFVTCRDDDKDRSNVTHVSRLSRKDNVDGERMRSRDRRDRDHRRHSPFKHTSSSTSSRHRDNKQFNSNSNEGRRNYRKHSRGRSSSDEMDRHSKRHRSDASSNRNRSKSKTTCKEEKHPKTKSLTCKEEMRSKSETPTCKEENRSKSKSPICKEERHPKSETPMLEYPICKEEGHPKTKSSTCNEEKHIKCESPIRKEEKRPKTKSPKKRNSKPAKDSRIDVKLRTDFVTDQKDLKDLEAMLIAQQKILDEISRNSEQQLDEKENTSSDDASEKLLEENGSGGLDSAVKAIAKETVISESKITAQLEDQVATSDTVVNQTNVNGWDVSPESIEVLPVVLPEVLPVVTSNLNKEQPLMEVVVPAIDPKPFSSIREYFSPVKEPSTLIEMNADTEKDVQSTEQFLNDENSSSQMDIDYELMEQTSGETETNLPCEEETRRRESLVEIVTGPTINTDNIHESLPTQINASFIAMENCVPDGGFVGENSLNSSHERHVLSKSSEYTVEDVGHEIRIFLTRKRKKSSRNAKVTVIT